MRNNSRSKNLVSTSFLSKVRNIIHKFLLFIWWWVRICWYIFQRVFLIAFLTFLTVWLAWWLSQSPSNHRDWEELDRELPQITLSWSSVSIKNIRNHLWQSDKEFTPQYIDDVYNIDDIERLYYVITPFGDSDGPAHTMFSFSFSWWKHLVISPEIRKERGESFSAINGILNKYELQYVIGTESDVIKVRTNYRKNEVYTYPIKTEKIKIQQLFRSMLIRAQKLEKEPEFYNTLWNNCATSVLMHANALRTIKLTAGAYTLLPSHSDQIVYEAWLIDTELPLPEARKYYRIDERARSLESSDGDFSSIIRQTIR